VEAGLGIVILPREAEVVLDFRDSDISVAKRVIFRSPYNPTAARDQLLGGALVVVLVPVVLAAYFDKERIGSPLGLRRPSIGPQLSSRCVILTDQTFVAVYKMGPDTVNVSRGVRGCSACRCVEEGKGLIYRFRP
jgi:hypothetical protein